MIHIFIIIGIIIGIVLFEMLLFIFGVYVGYRHYSKKLLSIVKNELRLKRTTESIVQAIINNDDRRIKF